MGTSHQPLSVDSKLLPHGGQNFVARRFQGQVQGGPCRLFVPPAAPGPGDGRHIEGRGRTQAQLGFVLVPLFEEQAKPHPVDALHDLKHLVVGIISCEMSVQTISPSRRSWLNAIPSNWTVL